MAALVTIRGDRARQGWRVGAPLRRPNPSDVVTLAPKWHPLAGSSTKPRSQKRYDAHVRKIAKGESGVYAFRHRQTGAVLYVGESHTGRLWPTLLRHVQPGDRGTCTKKTKDGSARAKKRRACLLFEDVGEWVYKGAPGDLDVAVWIVRAGEAEALEGEVIERLDPVHNEVPNARGASDEVPF